MQLANLEVVAEVDVGQNGIVEMWGRRLAVFIDPRAFWWQHGCALFPARIVHIGRQFGYLPTAISKNWPWKKH